MEIERNLEGYKKVFFDSSVCGERFPLLLTEDQLRVFEFLIKKRLIEGTISPVDENIRWEKI